jgi:hypothetical protein
MSLTLRLLLKSLLLLVGVSSFAQPAADKGCKPPKSRELWHDHIDKEQKNALRAFQGNGNEEIKYHVIQSISKRVDDFQCYVETDSAIRDQQKVGYLRGMENLVKKFTALYKNKQFNPSHFPAALDAYEEAMARDAKGQSIESIIDQNSYEVSKLVVESDAFRNNPGLKISRNCLLRKYMAMYPEQIFITLKDNPDLPFRDSLIRVAAYKYPKRLYDFAAANNRLGNAIQNIQDDSLIKAIAKMARSGGSGQLYFPFLDNIITGRTTLADIDRVKSDDGAYYKLLVKTRMDYVSRSLEGEKIVSMNDLDAMLKTKAISYYIKDINERHEEPDATRFRILEQLNAQELYYLVIAGETDLYTSSYVHGIYPRMMQRINQHGDSLLTTVKFDRFKKFLKIAAGYNTLSNFLGTMEKDRAQLLMTAFVNKLEESTGLEDGVDVADSYASIVETIKPVAEDMLSNVKQNLDRNIQNNNKRGVVIYNLLYKLFLSVDSTKNIDLTREFGIPPVYNIAYQSLIDDSASKVVMQVFFYGDDDGKMNWNGFIPQYQNANWKKVEDNKYWLAFASTKGKPMVVYANKWFDDEKQPGELDKAQAALDAYLNEKGIEPSVIVHRGHSYWVKYTIDQITPAAKIVLLGSCGGYNVIHSVLQHAPDAHIVASKQTGKKDINQPLINILNDKLRNGNNIDWIPFWKEFRAKAGNVEGFDDYVPPYKNLGALFIKAYNSSMGGEEL